MIQNVKINNFKALKHVNIETSSLNIFTGLNGMGKSTTLQALMLLRQSRKNKFEDLVLNDNIDLGTFRDVFCESSSSDRTLSLGVTWNDNDELLVERKYEPSLGEEKSLTGGALDFYISDKALFSETAFKYLSAHRIKPQDTYETNSSMVKNGQLGNEGQFAAHFYHLNRNEPIPIKELAYDDENTVFSLEQQVNNWLSIISPKVRVFTEIKDGSLVQLSYSYATKMGVTSKFSPKNAGFGLTYVFSVLVAILSAKPGDILLIENPESHIHPKGQTELARLMALAATNGVQIFCETHSDHVLYGVRIAIKEKDISEDDVSVYYIDRDEDEHFSKASKIIIDKNGRLDRASKSYFIEYESHLDKLLG